MTKRHAALTTGALLCLDPLAQLNQPSSAMPMSGGEVAGAAVELSSTVQSRVECDRYRERCWAYPSYYDTPPHLRPRVFYGYEPHRHGDWFRYYSDTTDLAIAGGVRSLVESEGSSVKRPA